MPPTVDDLTPTERDRVQVHVLRRWLDARFPRPGRRKGDRRLRYPLSDDQARRWYAWRRQNHVDDR